MTYKGIFLSVFNNMKTKAVKRKIFFDLTIEYIGDLFEKQKGICVYTGEKLTLKKNTKDTSQTASLDRIDSTKGYVVNNVHWVNKKINKLKNNFNEKEFLHLCSIVAKHKKTKVFNKEKINELAKLLMK